MTSRVIKLRDNPAKLVIGLDYGWQTFSDAVCVPFDNERGVYLPGYWHKPTLDKLLATAEGPKGILGRLMEEGKISSPDNVLFVVDLVLDDSDQRKGYGTDALNQLYELVGRGIDVSDLSNHVRGRIMPQRGDIKFYEYLMGEVQKEAIGFFEKMHHEKLGGAYMGISLKQYIPKDIEPSPMKQTVS